MLHFLTVAPLLCLKIGLLKTYLSIGGVKDEGRTQEIPLASSRRDCRVNGIVKVG